MANSFLKERLFRFISKKAIDNPIFIVGLRRSGTTAIQNALGAHPQVLVGPVESPLIAEIGTLLSTYLHGDLSGYYRDSNRMDEKRMLRKLASLNFNYAIGYKIKLSSFFKLLLQSITLKDKQALRKKYWTAKIFPDKKSFDALNALYPNAKYIYICRNGIDQINSSMKHQEFKGKEFKAYCEHYRMGVEHYKYMFDEERVMIIKQEELSMNGEEIIKSVLEFLNIPHHNGPVKYATGSLVHSLSNTDTKGSVDVKTEFEKRESAWTSWPDDHKEEFIKTCSDAMEFLGYKIPDEQK